MSEFYNIMMTFAVLGVILITGLAIMLMALFICIIVEHIKFIIEKQDWKDTPPAH